MYCLYLLTIEHYGTNKTPHNNRGALIPRKNLQYRALHLTLERLSLYHCSGYLYLHFSLRISARFYCAYCDRQMFFSVKIMSKINAFASLRALPAACVIAALCLSLSGCTPPGSARNNAETNKLAIPPGLSAADNQAPQDTSAQTSANAPQGLEGLKGISGVNVDELFSQELSDESQRFERLEQSVSDLRREFETYKPMITRLVAIEGDIQNLIVALSEELEVPPDPPQLPPITTNQTANNAPQAGNNQEVPTLPQAQQQLIPDSSTPNAASATAGSEPTATINRPETPPAVPTSTIEPPAPLPPLQQAIQPAPQQTSKEQTPKQQAAQAPKTAKQAAETAAQNNASTSATKLNRLRLGAHEGFTRLVIDAEAPTPYEAVLNQTSTALTLNFDDAQWVGANTKNYTGHPLISSYEVTKTQANTPSMTVRFKSPVTIGNQETLVKNSAPAFRIVIDVRPK